MKYSILAAAVIAGAASAQVGVSVNVGEPGFFGQVDIGGAPPPELVAAQPVVIAPAPEFVGAPPIYLHVRPGYEGDWRHHCFEYNACGRPVYFVSDNWYNQVYVAHHMHPEHGWPAYRHGGEVRHEEMRHEEMRHAEVRHAEEHHAEVRHEEHQEERHDR